MSCMDLVAASTKIPETWASANKRMACLDCGDSGARAYRTTRGENPGRAVRVCPRCLDRWVEFGLQDRRLMYEEEESGSPARDEERELIMGVLSWDTPKRVMSKEQWSAISADGAPPGVYVPNMSDVDQKKWKAKLVGHKVGLPRVEIRKTAGSQILIVVALTGTKYPDKYGKPTSGEINVHISANGPMYFSFEEMQEMQTAVAEARALLETTSNETLGSAVARALR